MNQFIQDFLHVTESAALATYPWIGTSKANMLAANLYLPADFDESKQYPAITVAHPGGGVKEQTAGM